MSISNYYWLVAHEHVQLLLFTNAWPWEGITLELRMSVGTYYWRVAHENEHLLLLSNKCMSSY